MAHISKSSADQAFLPDIEAPAVSVGDVPTGKTVFWWDTLNTQLYLVKNRAGVLYFVELTREV